MCPSGQSRVTWLAGQIPDGLSVTPARTNPCPVWVRLLIENCHLRSTEQSTPTRRASSTRTPVQPLIRNGPSRDARGRRGRPSRQRRRTTLLHDLDPGPWHDPQSVGTAMEFGSTSWPGQSLQPSRRLFTFYHFLRSALSHTLTPWCQSTNGFHRPPRDNSTRPNRGRTAATTRRQDGVPGRASTQDTDVSPSLGLEAGVTLLDGLEAAAARDACQR